MGTVYIPPGSTNGNYPSHQKCGLRAGKDIKTDIGRMSFRVMLWKKVQGHRFLFSNIKILVLIHKIFTYEMKL